MHTMTDFIDKHGLWNDEQRAAARDALDVVTNKALRCVRVSVADPQGKLRSKTSVYEDRLNRS